MSVRPQFDQLSKDLQRLKADEYASMPIANLFNTLLEAAKAERPDDAVIGSIQPIQEDGLGTASETNGTLAVLTGQILASIPRPAPRLA